MILQFRIKSVLRAALAASMLAVVACESTTSPVARAAEDNAQFGKSGVVESTAIVVSATNATVGQAVNVTATLYTSGHPLGGKKLFLTVDGGSPVWAPCTRLGVATWSVQGLAAGTHTIVVTFGGDSGHSGSSATTTATVYP